MPNEIDAMAKPESKSMLKLRVITSLVLAPFLIWLLFFSNQQAFMLATIAMVSIAAWEWARLSNLKNFIGQLMYALTLGLICYLINQYSSAVIEYLDIIFWGSLVFWLLATAQIFIYPRIPLRWQEHTPIKLLIGFIILLPFWLALNVLYQIEPAPWFCLLSLSLVWAADIGAYFSGIHLGKNKLMPKVSPSKTLEGLLGGVIAALITGCIFLFFLKPSGSNGLWLTLFVIASLISVTGDLFESLMKRHQGVKDSSQILPGHGGVMDRIDALTASLPIFLLLADHFDLL